MEARHHTESVASTERDGGPMTSKQIGSEYSYKYASNAKVTSFKSPQGDIVKHISSSVLGQRAKYSTKLPNISRQPGLETNSLSGVTPQIDDSYYLPDDNLEGNRTQKVADISIKRRKMKKVPVLGKNDFSDSRFMSSGQMNIMQKFLDHANVKVRHDNISIQPKMKNKSPRLNAIQSKNLPYNDSAELAKKLKMLENQLGQLDDEYETLRNDNEELIEQNNYMKDINKNLFMKMRDNEEELKDENDSGNFLLHYTIDFDRSEAEPKALMISQFEKQDIHSMYQDLFLTDMKREVEDAQSELKQ